MYGKWKNTVKVKYHQLPITSNVYRGAYSTKLQFLISSFWDCGQTHRHRRKQYLLVAGKKYCDSSTYTVTAVFPHMIWGQQQCPALVEQQFTLLLKQPQHKLSNKTGVCNNNKMAEKDTRAYCSYLSNF